MANFLNALQSGYGMGAGIRERPIRLAREQEEHDLSTQVKRNALSQSQAASAEKQQQADNTFKLNAAKTLAGLKTNPAMFNQAADFFASHETAQRLGIRREAITPESVDGFLAQAQIGAGEAPDGGENDAAVHSTVIGDDGNLYIVPKKGTTPVNTNVRASKFAPRAIETDAGTFSYNPRTQSLSAPLITQDQQVSGAAAKAGAVEASKTIAGAKADAQVNLGSNLDEINKMREQVSGLLSDPGFDTIYGASSVVDPRNYIRGTDAANAAARREQIDAQAFGISIQKMKGLGALSNAEGSRVTAAFTRATNPKLSAVEAKKAWVEVQHYLDLAERRAKQKAGPQAPQATEPQAEITATGPNGQKIVLRNGQWVPM